MCLLPQSSGHTPSCPQHVTCRHVVVASHRSPDRVEETTQGYEWVTKSKMYCLRHGRPVLQEMGCGGRNSSCIQKAGRPRRRWTHVPKNRLTCVRIPAPFTPQGQGGKSDASWFPSASRGVCSFLPARDHSQADPGSAVPVSRTRIF